VVFDNFDCAMGDLLRVGCSLSFGLDDAGSAGVCRLGAFRLRAMRTGSELMEAALPPKRAMRVTGSVARFASARRRKHVVSDLGVSKM
jgi:hypothetical protein